MASDFNPVAIILVTSGTRGKRLLFRYPYCQETKTQPKVNKSRGQNPYALKIAENLQGVKKGQLSVTSFLKDGVLANFSDKTLANILCVKSDLCGKFSLEVDDVRFVGYPISLQHVSSCDTNLGASQSSSSSKHSIVMLNVVFVLKTGVRESVISCYQELAQQLAVAIAQEEKRCQYLTKEAKIMVTAFDEASVAAGGKETISPLNQIIYRSKLGGELKSVYDSLKQTGQVLFYLNQWVEINFCLPHKVHAMHTPGRVVQLEAIYRCLSYVRPYHGILLTKPEKELLNFLPLDASPSLIRLIKMTTPIKNLIRLSLETDLSITQIYQLVCHMIYWGFAMLVYPLCQSNLYVLSSSANTAVKSTLSREFSLHFPGFHLHEEMARFSFPSPMHDTRDIMVLPGPMQHDRLNNQVVVWMLQHRLLNQWHTYVFLATARRKEVKRETGMISTHSSSSSVQVVEESYLSVLMEDPPASTLDRTTSMSDVASVNSEDSQSAANYTSLLSKSPSVDAPSDCSVAAEEAKAQWRVQDSLLSELKPQVKVAILGCPASRNTDDLHLFAKLCPYFNGKHHLEEMMFYENLSRSQLNALLDKFKEVLIFCSHEDTATTLL